MYLTDREILARLDDFGFEAEHEEFAFDPAVQIGPCSVDLRLSLVHWKPQRRRFGRPHLLDLSRPREIAPFRGWRRFELKPGDKITLRPGEMVLGRVAETFRLPSDCAGAIEGRSSYARLGLQVHTAGGFINPGWRGHMPLSLVNHSPFILRIPVGTPVAQLMIVRLAEAVDRDYEARASHKYLDDSGGPSYWWRDVIMEKIHASLAGNIDHRVFAELDDVLSESADDSMINRLEAYVMNQRGRKYGSATELLDGFAESEGRRQKWEAVTQFVARWAWTVAVPFAASTWIGSHSLLARIVLGALGAASLISLVWSLWRGSRSFLTSHELHRVMRLRDRPE